jgi:hypothetical protein
MVYGLSDILICMLIDIPESGYIRFVGMLALSRGLPLIEPNGLEVFMVRLSVP